MVIGELILKISQQGIYVKMDALWDLLDQQQLEVWEIIFHCLAIPAQEKIRATTPPDLLVPYRCLLYQQAEYKRHARKRCLEHLRVPQAKRYELITPRTRKNGNLKRKGKRGKGKSTRLRMEQRHPATWPIESESVVWHKRQWIMGINR